MIYRPVVTRKLWDTWLFPWEGQFHLFFLETQETNLDHVGRAVSDDLVHWKTLPSIRTKGEKGEWNHWGTLAGMVVPHDGRFYMFVGSIPDQQEVVGMWVSDDLEHWVPHPGNPVLYPAGPHYLTDRARAPYWPVDWRDPHIFWREEDQHYHAILCARLPQWSHEDTGAALAHVRSRDLIHWEHLPPLATPGRRFFNTEVPDLFELNGRYYLTFNTSSLAGIKINTPHREEVTGAFYMVAPSFEGPFRLPDDPLLIGAGYAKQCAYSARTIPYEGGRLLYHHVGGERPAWAAPKMVRAEDDGTLWLEYMPVLEKLETEVVCGSIKDIPSSESADLGCWKRSGNRLVGTAIAMGTSYKVACDAADLHFQCRVSVSSAACAGVVLRGDPDKQGVAILLDFEHQRIQIGPAKGPQVMKGSVGAFASWHYAFLDTCLCRLVRGKLYHLRCFARDEHFEVYLDGRWIFTTVMTDAPKRGNVELCVERGEAEFTDLRIANIESLA